jgi:UDP-N-acetylmuramoyl-tripeptide--D-alanyl-D-alanine ligase
MGDVLLTVIILVWLVGTWVRVFKQARFFQIEEYMIRRYLRWWIQRRERSLPRRPLVAAAAGMALAAIFSESPDSPLPDLIAVMAGTIAVWPPDEGEIKKAFVRTPRATRILGASFLVAVGDIALYLLLVSHLNIDSHVFQILAVTLAGLTLYLTAPLILSLGSLLMVPVEAFLRRQYIVRARSVLDEIQPTVVGITGSYGKTTTKTFLAQILNGRYKTYPTPKSYNTMMGVCRAINEHLATDYSVEYFIVEMGAYVEGEIRRICDLTPPRIAIVVEIGPQHLERFGSIEKVVAAKYEIIQALPSDGVGVFNWDNKYVREMYHRNYPNTRIAVSKDPAPLPSYEVGAGPRFVAANISESIYGLSFTIKDRETGDIEAFNVPVPGEHNVTNILLATAVAVHEGMPLRDVALRARRLQPAESRLAEVITREGITIINDGYSANPVGVVSALKTLGLRDSGKRLVVTPGMVELGELHETENHKLGQLMAEYATDVILVGSAQTMPVRAGLESAGFPADRLQVVEELRDAMTWYQANLKGGDTVMFLNDLPDTY